VTSITDASKNIPLIRHPGEGRGPVESRTRWTKSWIPAFAGMTVLKSVLVTATSVLALATAAHAVTPNDATTGSLLLKAKDGTFLEAPRQASDYNVTISGPTGRTVLTQRFENPAEGWVEGVYVFPLPEGAAVDTLKIIAGNRVIVGEVKEKQEAKVIYEEAKASGQTASLVEQERPNIFTNSIANIGPHETVIVQIEYQEAIKQTAGTYSLRLPLVVAPRYNPSPILQTVDFKADGTGVLKSVDPVPDRDRITPPILDPRKSSAVNPVSISVQLNAGFDLADVKSSYHTIATKVIDADSQVIGLGEGEVPANKDFELTWTAKGEAPQVGIFKEAVKGKDYLLATVTPPSIETVANTQPRETVFVIDNSGSMEGPSMQQAKDALIRGLDTLRPGDRFNIIRFDDTYTEFFPQPVVANAANLKLAKDFVNRLNANGGTEMVPALREALVDDTPSETGFLRQVVFMTDGAIGNEQEMFAMLTKMRGRSRVFMVGIGSAPNSYLMTRAAELGRGTFTFIGDASQVQGRMQELFAKIGQPVVTGLKAEIDGSDVKLSPSTLPDLYRGEPVLMMAEAAGLKGTLKVSGMIGQTPWSVSLPVEAAAPGTGINKLWAHRKVADYEVASTLGEMSYEAMNKAILDVALTHQIVSSQTSLIAVDKSPKRPPGYSLTRADIPLNLPAGWDYDKVFGGDTGSPPPKFQRDASLYKTLATSEAPVQLAAAPAVNLPKTATPAQLYSLMAGMLAAMGLAMRLAAGRRRNTNPLGA
jgi:Ca-activated chloride channel homolog